MPSWPAGLASTGRYSPFQAISATVTHHGMLLGRLLASGAAVALGAEMVDDFTAGNEGALKEDEEDMVIFVKVIVVVDSSSSSLPGGNGVADGCTVTLTVVVTCVVLRPLAGGADAGTQVSMTGGLAFDDGATLLELESVIRVVEVGLPAGVVKEPPGELLAGALDVLGGASPEHFRSIRG